MTDEAEAFRARMHDVEHTVALGDAAVEAAVLAERRRCLALLRDVISPWDDTQTDDLEDVVRAIEEGRQP